jgi:hypothetical protein
MDTIIENLPIPWLPLPNTQSGLCDVAYTLQDNTSLQFDQDWKDLRFLPWRFFYLDYLHLQRMIQQHSNTVIIDRKLEDEWKKVNKKANTYKKVLHIMYPRYMISIC